MTTIQRRYSVFETVKLCIFANWIPAIFSMASELCIPNEITLFGFATCMQLSNEIMKCAL